MILLNSSTAFSANTNLQEALFSLKSSNDPLANKLYLWLTVTEKNQTVDSKELIDFTINNNQWPKLYKFYSLIEEDINAYMSPIEVVIWFRKNPPRSYNGIIHNIKALLKLERKTKAIIALQKFWLNAELSKKETLRLSKKYKKMFSPSDHINRLDSLLWQRRYKEAEYMFSLVSKDYRDMALARMSLGRLSGEASSLLNKVSRKLIDHPGIIYDRVRWRRIKNKDNEALQMLKKQPANAPYLELWWKERNILSRRAIEDHQYQKAYDIISKHGMTEGDYYIQAEWLLGWLAVSFLNKPVIAYRHFESFYQNVSSAISRSRATYWLAKADEAMDHATASSNWHKLSAQFPSTFYGQLSHEKTYGTINSSNFMDDQLPSEAAYNFNRLELVKTIKLLVKLNLTKYADPFFTKLLNQAKTRADYILISKLAKEIEYPRFSVEANKKMQQNIGSFMFNEGYPLLDTKTQEDPEKALIHAIVYRESMFDHKAQSFAGARGLMQLMPLTAKNISRGLRQHYSPHKLTQNPNYNVKLGSAYLNQLILKYKGSYPLAIAAYNAGPNNVNKWIKMFGDPRKENIDIIDWIELIPFYETRNYVQRVMETYYMYKLKFTEKPKTVLDF